MLQVECRAALRAQLGLRRHAPPRQSLLHPGGLPDDRHGALDRRPHPVGKTAARPRRHEARRAEERETRIADVLLARGRALEVGAHPRARRHRRDARGVALDQVGQQGRGHHLDLDPRRQRHELFRRVRRRDDFKALGRRRAQLDPAFARARRLAVGADDRADRMAAAREDDHVVVERRLARPLDAPAAQQPEPERVELDDPRLRRLAQVRRNFRDRHRHDLLPLKLQPDERLRDKQHPQHPEQRPQQREDYEAGEHRGS